MYGSARKLYASLTSFLVALGGLLALLIVTTARDSNREGGIIVTVFIVLLFAVLVPKALVLDERGIRRVTFLPVPLPRRYRMIRWEDVIRFYPNGDDVLCELRPNVRHRLYLPGQKKGGGFRARFNTTGYFASPLLPSSLADLLNEELAARRPDVTELPVSQE